MSIRAAAGRPVKQGDEQHAVCCTTCIVRRLLPPMCCMYASYPPITSCGDNTSCCLPKSTGCVQIHMGAVPTAIQGQKHCTKTASSPNVEQSKQIPGMAHGRSLTALSIRVEEWCNPAPPPTPLAVSTCCLVPLLVACCCCCLGALQPACALGSDCLPAQLDAFPKHLGRQTSKYAFGQANNRCGQLSNYPGR